MTKSQCKYNWAKLSREEKIRAIMKRLHENGAENICPQEGPEYESIVNFEYEYRKYFCDGITPTNKLSIRYFNKKNCCVMTAHPF